MSLISRTKYIHTTAHYLRAWQRMGGGGAAGHKRVWPLAETPARRREPGLRFLWGGWGVQAIFKRCSRGPPRRRRPSAWAVVGTQVAPLSTPGAPASAGTAAVAERVKRAAGGGRRRAPRGAAAPSPARAGAARARAPARRLRARVHARPAEAVAAPAPAARSLGALGGAAGPPRPR